jgi:predicted transcriptional regulator
MPDTKLSVRVPEGLAGRLERVAKATARSRSYVTLRALEAYCDTEEAVLSKIRQGLADAEAGRVVSHARVAPWLRDLAAGKVRRPPRPR